jgi:hypothetical protein
MLFAQWPGVLLTTPGTKHTVGLSFDWMLLKHTRNEYCNLYGNSHYVILLDVIQTPINFDDRVSVSLRQDV